MSSRTTVRYVMAVVALCSLSDHFPAAVDFDLLIEHGRLYDGTGNLWYAADVGITGDTIVEIGNLSGRRASRTIDATGMVVSPGFIDMHTHVDRAFDNPETGAILNYLFQGVTTVRPGSDGGSDHRVSETKSRWEANGMGTNAVLMVGFNNIRRQIMGSGQAFLRPATSDQVEAMRLLARQGMREGAFGLSAGVEYDGLHLHAGTEEIIGVTRAVSDFDGVYICHCRDEGRELVESVHEVIRISEETGVPVQVTHMKATGRLNWGLMPKAVGVIVAARARGVPITADQYPWDQSAPYGYITALVDVPSDLEAVATFRSQARDPHLSDDERAQARQRFVVALQDALQVNEQREMMRASTYEEREAGWHPVSKWGWQDFTFKHAIKNRHLLQRNIYDLEREQDRDGFDIVAELILDEPDMIFAGGSMSSDDVRHLMAQPWVMISSDGGAAEPGDRPVPSHPRSFASQAVLLRQYVRDEGVVTLADGIRKMTFLPAQFLGLRDRGLILEGFKADLAVFDPEEVQDQATWADSRRYAVGFQYVVVNGELSIDEGEYTGARAGMVLLKR